MWTDYIKKNSLSFLNRGEEAPVDDFFEDAKDAGVEIEIPDEEVSEGIGAEGDLFVPRLTRPSKTNKYYLRVGFGGVNECIAGKPEYCKGSALSNCVGYSWGRVFELLEKRPKLSRANAEDWWNHKDGYPRIQEPKLGAVAVWRKGKAGDPSDGAGHVAVVEVYDKTAKEIRLSNSGYGSTVFYLTKYKLGNMNHGKYTFMGFIDIGDFKEEETVDVTLKVLKHESPTMKCVEAGTVQILLNKKNNARLSVDNSYGPATEKAVKAWQKKKGLTVDGIVGLKTWESLLK